MKIKKYEKITNIVDNMHNQLASYLTKNYKTIIAPQLEVKKLVAITEVNTSGETVEKPRVLSSTNSRFMNTFAFYRFHQKLKSLSALRNCKLYIVNEAYTSKTCGICGTLNNDLGGSKTFKCVNPECKIKIDRDYNGARNILLKHLI
jgi:putative transposase